MFCRHPLRIQTFLIVFALQHLEQGRHSTSMGSKQSPRINEAVACQSYMKAGVSQVCPGGNTAPAARRFPRFLGPCLWCHVVGRARLPGFIRSSFTSANGRVTVWNSSIQNIRPPPRLGVHLCTRLKLAGKAKVDDLRA